MVSARSRWIPAFAGMTNFYFYFSAALPALHRIEELVVRLRVLHLVEHELDCRELVHRMDQLAQDPDLLQQVRLDQQLFAARAGAVDVQRRIDALLGDAAVKMHFG